MTTPSENEILPVTTVATEITNNHPNAELLHALEDRVVDAIANIPPEESIHRTIRAVAIEGESLGISPHELKRIFLHNPRITHLLENDINHVLDHFSLESSEPMPDRLKEESICNTVISLMTYFLKSVEEGSMYNHLKSFIDQIPEDDKKSVMALLSSKKFRSIIINTYRAYVGVLLDELHPHEKIRAVRHHSRGKFKPLTDEEVLNPKIPAQPPFDMLLRFRCNGLMHNNRAVATIAGEAYTLGVLTCLDCLNSSFYLSNSEFPKRYNSQPRNSFEDNSLSVE